MKRVLLVFCLLSLSAAVFIPAQAQEAFYIYRNDGDFNGFFYDEVVEMRQSKLGVDSIEYDKWVTQEVVLADTIYRIPLAAIDSIGFQQPEIKLNPKVKFIERDGYSPYLVSVSPFTNVACGFQDLPANMIPQVGDVLIALPTDSKAEEMYYYYYGSERRGGSWSCVVDYVSTGSDNYTSVKGHWVDQISDVFEQYITVEQIGVDENNQIHRRIAGCTPDGLPCRIQRVSDEGEINLIDFTGTLTHSWNPTEGSSVDLSADVGIKVRLRVAYNITWTKFYVKMSKDFVLSIKPSIGLALSHSWIGTPGKFLWMPEISFPTVAPIFRVNPLPDVFVRTSGSIEARFNMPQVKLGLGTDFIMNSDEPFPVYMTMHTVPDDEAEVTDDMLDLSRSVKISGSLQVGIEFQAIIGTAAWFKKIVDAEIGLHLYTGPKLSAELSYDTNVTPENSNYHMLSNGRVNLALLALDLEAGATAGVMWDDPEEVTFFNKSWEFLVDTCRLAPLWYASEVEMQDKDVKLIIKPHQGLIFRYNYYKIGIFNDENNDEKPIVTLGDWHEYEIGAEAELSHLIAKKDLQAGNYDFCPLVSSTSMGDPYRVTGLKGGKFTIPYEIELNPDELHFDFKGSEQSLTFTANCPKDQIDVHYNGAINWITSNKIDSVSEGQYELTVKAKPNRLMFRKKILDEGDQRLCIAGYRDTVYHYINFIQDENDLQNVKLNFYFNQSGFTDNENSWHGWFFPTDSVLKGTRVGAHQIVLHREIENTDANRTYEADITIERYAGENEYDSASVSGYFKTTYTRSWSNGETETEVTTATFQDGVGCQNSINNDYRVSAPLSSGTYDYVKKDQYGAILQEKHTTMQPGSTMGWYFIADVPSK